MTGPSPAVDVLDILAQAAAEAALDADEDLWTYEGNPVMAAWRPIAEAVREAWRPYQSPTQDAYSAATRATRFHRQRAALLVDLATQLLAVHPDDTAAEKLALLSNDRVPTEGGPG